MKRRKPSSDSFKVFLVSLFMAASFAAGYITSEVVHEPSESTPVLSVPSNAVRTCFSPRGGCEEKILQELKKAEFEILVHAYAFTSMPIADALIEAKDRGVVIKILCDKSQMNGRKSQIKRLLKSGIDVRLHKVPGIAHNKVIILDQETTITGSYNFTESANTRNAENLLFIKDKPLARVYKDNWIKRQASSLPIEAVLFSS